MTDQTIPAEKVQELAEKYDNAPGNPDRLLVNAIADLRALLPAPPQPLTGLLGRWAKHPEYGDVLCMWDKPSRFGKMRVAHVSEGKTSGAEHWYAEFDSLTFPHQAAKPEDVRPGEAWLVDVEDSEESHKSIVALKYACDDWRTSDEVTNWGRWHDNEVTLIAPLTPERPGKDDEGFLAENERIFAAYSECAEALQARYDELDKSWCYLDGKYSTLREDYDALEAKYREAQEKIEALSQSTTPRTVTTKEEYAALPKGSMFVDADDDVWRKVLSGNWIQEMSYQMLSDAKLSGTTRTVLRYGWGDEQPKPAWRIEAHNPDNFRVGEFIIDCDGDSGTVTPEWIELWDTDEDIFGARRFAPFIVFPSKDAATPEAVAEAKRAQDKEMEK